MVGGTRERKKVCYRSREKAWNISHSSRRNVVATLIYLDLPFILVLHLDDIRLAFC